MDRCRETRQKAALGVVLALLAVAPVPATRAEEAHTTRAEIRIGLPIGVEPRVAVSPGTQRIVVDLPEGAELPEDFAAASAGLLHGGRVLSRADGRMQIEVDLALGVLDRVEFEPGAVVLRLESRFELRSKRLEETPEDLAEQYRIGADDELLVTVHGQEDLTGPLTVTRDGFITAPLVGDVEAAGLTPRRLAARIAELLSRDYLVDPQVDVAVTKHNSQWAMVAGEIRIPGRVPLRGGTRLKHVLSEAGGFAETAGEEITITRKVAGSTAYERMTVERRAFERGDADPPVEHGDIVTVEQAKFAYVQGEVGVPTRVRIERDTTLLKALTQAGGLTDWANRRKVQILQGDGTKPRTFNIKDIQSGRVADPALVGGEIVVVARRFF